MQLSGMRSVHLAKGATSRISFTKFTGEHTKIGKAACLSDTEQFHCIHFNTSGHVIAHRLKPKQTKAMHDNDHGLWS